MLVLGKIALGCILNTPFVPAYVIWCVFLCVNVVDVLFSEAWRSLEYQQLKLPLAEKKILLY